MVYESAGSSNGSDDSYSILNEDWYSKLKYFISNDSIIIE